jgi:hypothetical protein
VSDVVVTAIKLKSNGTDAYDIWVQDPAATENAGLMIFTGSAAIQVKVGDTLDVSGELDVFNGLLEVVKPTVMVKSSGPLTILPTVVDPALVKTGGADSAKYMSMLVSIENVSIVNIAAGAKPTDDEMEVTGGLILDDFAYDYDATKFMNGQALSKVVGPLHFFNKAQLLPRSADDLKLAAARSPPRQSGARGSSGAGSADAPGGEGAFEGSVVGGSRLAGPFFFADVLSVSG